jgi:hypothetical protein
LNYQTYPGKAEKMFKIFIPFSREQMGTKSTCPPQAGVARYKPGWVLVLEKKQNMGTFWNIFT